MEKTVDDIVLWLREKVYDAGAKGIVFGLSGGVDSAVVAGLGKRAFPNNTLGIIMPCHSDNQDELHGRLVGESLDIDIKKVDLSSIYDSFLEVTDIEEKNELAMANIKPRLRMTTLYYYAQSMNYLVVGPTNKSEMTTGYFTKHGDSGVDLLPIADIIKEDIWKMAKYLDIPEIVINKAPSAGLWTDQTDQDEMGFSYDILDKYIKTGKADGKIKDKIDSMNNRSKHKKQFPPIYRIR